MIKLFLWTFRRRKEILFIRIVLQRCMLALMFPIDLRTLCIIFLLWCCCIIVLKGYKILAKLKFIAIPPPSSLWKFAHTWSKTYFLHMNFLFLHSKGAIWWPLGFENWVHELCNMEMLAWIINSLIWKAPNF